MTIEENGPKYAVVLLVDITLQLVRRRTGNN